MKATSEHLEIHGCELNIVALDATRKSVATGLTISMIWDQFDIKMEQHKKSHFD